jgi:hypothetical protein
VRTRRTSPNGDTVTRRSSTADSSTASSGTATRIAAIAGAGGSTSVGSGRSPCRSGASASTRPTK